MIISEIPTNKLITITVKYIFALNTALSVIAVENPFDKSRCSRPLYEPEGINIFMTLFASPIQSPINIVRIPDFIILYVLIYFITTVHSKMAMIM